jgi:hypothetical protein
MTLLSSNSPTRFTKEEQNLLWRLECEAQKPFSSRLNFALRRGWFGEQSSSSHHGCVKLKSSFTRKPILQK